MKGTNPNNSSLAERLDSLEDLPANHYDKDAGWERLQARLEIKPKKKLLFSFLAAACILLILGLWFMSGPEKYALPRKAAVPSGTRQFFSAKEIPTEKLIGPGENRKPAERHEQGGFITVRRKILNVESPATNSRKLQKDPLRITLPEIASAKAAASPMHVIHLNEISPGSDSNAVLPDGRPFFPINNPSKEVITGITPQKAFNPSFKIRL